jgi:hypothetical protein
MFLFEYIKVNEKGAALSEATLKSFPVLLFLKIDTPLDTLSAKRIRIYGDCLPFRSSLLSTSSSQALTTSAISSSDAPLNSSDP